MRLLDKRYEEIKRIVVSLFTELNLYNVPVDCFKICELLVIRVIKYSEVKEEKRKACKEFSKDGFFLEKEKNGQSVFEIYYDDSMYDRRIRFTIMHEIGHIVLDHTEHSDLAESEANFFAKYALAPPPLIHKYKPEDYYELAEIFQLSQECAMNAMKFYHRWLRLLWKIRFTVDHLKLNAIVVYDDCGTNDRVMECFAYAISKGVEIIIPDNTLKARNAANRKAVSRNG